MRRNPCGIYELRRDSNGGYADVFCRVERTKRKKAIEDRYWAGLRKLHSGIIDRLTYL